MVRIIHALFVNDFLLWINFCSSNATNIIYTNNVNCECRIHPLIDSIIASIQKPSSGVCKSKNKRVAELHLVAISWYMQKIESSWPTLLISYLVFCRIYELRRYRVYCCTGHRGTQSIYQNRQPLRLDCGKPFAIKMRNYITLNLHFF